MTEKEALYMFEKGEAHGVYTSVLIISTREGTWFSFDGKEWEKTDSNIIKKQVD